MSDYSIQKADFDKQKKELKKFSDQPATSTELVKFDTSGKFSDFLSGGLLGLIDHKVTGEEINELVTELQSCFKEINERERKVIKEFGQVYETFEALDKGYIQGILIGVKSAERASQEAKDAQKDIDDTIKALKRTIEKLKEFKNQVNGYRHLPEIDDLWVDVQQVDLEIGELKSGTARQKKLIEKTDKDLGQLNSKLGKVSHLYDVDSMWDDLLTVKKDAVAVKEDVEKTADDVSEIKDKIDSLINKLAEYEHLYDVDAMWEDVQSLKKDSSTYASSMEEKISIVKGDISDIRGMLQKQEHFGDIDETWNIAQKMKAESNDLLSKMTSLESAHSDLKAGVGNVVEFVDKMMTLEHVNDIDDNWEYVRGLGEEVRNIASKTSEAIDGIENNDKRLAEMSSENELLRKRMTIAYWVAGGALALSAIQLIMALMGII